MSWTPGPRYLLRRDCTLRLVSRLQPKRVLEIGCGGGDLALRLAKMNCDVVALDFSQEARAEAHARTEPVRQRVRIIADLSEAPGQFDLVGSFEVLEHIEDDRVTLRTWVEKIAPGGALLLSVPAHHRRWGPSDELVGHYRRYERHEIEHRLTEAGLNVRLIWNYGFPLANWVEPLREALSARRLKSSSDLSKEARSARSGVDRRSLERVGSLLVSPPVMLPFYWAQRPFLNRDCGNGYLALAGRGSEE